MAPMAKVSPAHLPPPNYGDLKPQVIAFLRELLMKGHKPEAAIGIWRKEGRLCLGIRCVHCWQYIAIPSDGSIEISWCTPPATAKGGA